MLTHFSFLQRKKTQVMGKKGCLHIFQILSRPNYEEDNDILVIILHLHMVANIV